jgi:RNA polymerase sigma-70 factor (sigma-E family)
MLTWTQGTPPTAAGEHGLRCYLGGCKQKEWQGALSRRDEADAAFADFARSREAGLVRAAYLLTGDWALAEDLVQETLLRTHRHWTRASRLTYADAYVRQILFRQFLSWKRRRAAGERVVASHLLSDNETAWPERATAQDHAIQHADRDAAWQLLATLTRRQRAVMVLRYYEDLPDERIAEVLGCSPSTVRVHAARALATLRARGGVSQAGQEEPR